MAHFYIFVEVNFGNKRTSKSENCVFVLSVVMGNKGPLTFGVAID